MSKLSRDEYPTDLAHWRQIIFRRLFGAMAIICVPVYITSVYLCVKQGLWSMVVVDTLAYLTLIALLLFPELEDKQRYLMGSLLCYGIGVAFIWSIGPTGAGFFWLFMFPLIGTLLLGRRIGIYCLMLTALTLTAMGLGFTAGWLPWPELPDYSLEIYLVVVLNFLTINVMLCLATGFLTDKLSDSLERTHASRRATVLGLARLSGFKDSDSARHLNRIARASELLTQALLRSPHRPDELTPEFAENIGLSATLHDIGMIGVADSLQSKQLTMTPAMETERYKHTLIGDRLLGELLREAPDCVLLAMARDIAAYHHERWDGEGFPGKLKGKSIPLAARVVALIDTVDDLLCHPDPRFRMTYEQALTHIKGLKGSILDPLLVDTFLTEPAMREIWH
ncbi:HD-GYP domain-containing protein [Shewanella litorisediminis]|uniref:HD domain-containing protein n=1 Tax=Shewanella litorisediminis TaxID=1173586 RepID=A0ABX7G647_9GAMM|nr:HD domain-containing phosphohydrolase [Shewanella litorisediminis]MCL2917691.1 HD domain-containing protein [Shewanella litorisediminis]QRH02811.1 HD domain-containing protein [Shewanella litorisediminis]